MTREMQDGINSDAAGMDHSIALVAFYIDGIYAWTASEIALFPRSVHVRIAVHWTTRDGHVIDCETGDATPAQAAAWAHQRRLDGYAWPTVYCSVSAQAAVIAAFQAIHEPMPLWWLAHYDNVDVLPAGAIAKQYADPGPLDRSVVADYWPGVDSGGPIMAVDPADVTAIADGVVRAFLAFRVNGRNVWDADQEELNQLFKLVAALATDEAAILAAIQGADADTKSGVVQLLAALAGVDADVKAGVQPAPVQVSPAALQTALAALNIPGAVVQALVALLAKAASTPSS
jgi:hypothetical protein